MTCIFYHLQHLYCKVLGDVWKYSYHLIRTHKNTQKTILKVKERKREREKSLPSGQRSPRCANVLQQGLSGLCVLHFPTSRDYHLWGQKPCHTSAQSDSVSDMSWKSQGPTPWPWGNTLKYPCEGKNVKSIKGGEKCNGNLGTRAYSPHIEMWSLC